MLKQVEKMSGRYGWVISFCIVMFFFLLFNIVATPLLNSGDDTYLMYTLSGGYGESPTNLLHYNYGWHFTLGWLVKSLFRFFPGINWYTLLLLLFHIGGCTALMYVLIKRLKIVSSLFFFSALFFFLETRMLLSLTFTGAAFVSATGGVCLLLHQIIQYKSRYGNSVFAILLLLLAGVLRLQIAWLVIILFAAVAITVLKRNQLLRFGFAMITVSASLFLLNKLHEQYYTKNIPGWQQQEKFRQALFYSYNRQLAANSMNAFFSDSAEAQLFFAGFLYDTSRFTTERIDKIGRQITRKRSLANKEDKAGLYWFFVEMRIYILLFVVMIGLALYKRQFLPVKKWLLSFLAFFAVHVYLFIYLKVTMPIHLGLLLFLWLALAMQLKEDLFLGNRKILITASVILVLLFGWMGVRLLKENKTNIERRQKFLCAVHELNQHKDKLFVATDDAFPLNYFYIWDSPSKYPATNLLYKDRLITFTYKKTLERFGIADLDDALVNNRNVYLLGRELPALEKGKQPAKLSGPLPVFKCLQVRQLNPAQ